MEKKLIRLSSQRFQRVMRATVMRVGLGLAKFKNLSHTNKDFFRRKFCYYSKIRSLKRLLLEKIAYIKSSPTPQRFGLALSDSRPIRVKNIFKNYCYYDNKCYKKRKKQMFYSRKRLKPTGLKKKLKQYLQNSALVFERSVNWTQRLYPSPYNKLFSWTTQKWNAYKRYCLLTLLQQVNKQLQRNGKVNNKQKVGTNVMKLLMKRGVLLNENFFNLKLRELRYFLYVLKFKRKKEQYNKRRKDLKYKRRRQQSLTKKLGKNKVFLNLVSHNRGRRRHRRPKFKPFSHLKLKKSWRQLSRAKVVSSFKRKKRKVMQKFRSWRITRVVKQRRKRKIWVPNPKQVRNHKNAFWKVDSAPSRFNAWKIRRVALVRGKFKFLEIKSSSCILTKRLRKYAKHRYAEYYRKGVTSLQAYWRFMRYRQHRFNRHFFINFQKYKKIKLRKRRKMRHLRFTGVKNRRKTRALQKKIFFELL